MIPGGAKIHQEEQDDQDGQRAALHRFVLKRGDGRANVERLIEPDFDLHVLARPAAW